MARMSRDGEKRSLAMPSKHFFKWGSTLVGSLVSDSISNISSLDKKKNLKIILIDFKTDAKLEIREIKTKN